MRNIKLIIEYDGTDFAGWQRQPNERTVMGTIEKALRKLTKEHIELVGAGRTDGGVHATGQVASFFTNSPIPPHKYKQALRFVLPPDISIVDSREVPHDFHARFSAKRKVYRYKIHTGYFPKALLRRYFFFFPFETDEELLFDAAKKLVGKHDFSSFMARGANAHNVFKTIYRFDVEKNGDLIEFVIEGDAFLRNMVRIMAGTVIYVACGRISIDTIDEMLKGDRRHLAGPTFGAEGLYLEEVIY